MDDMLIRHKSEFVAAVRSVLDMLYNQRDKKEVKEYFDPSTNLNKEINEDKTLEDNIKTLEAILLKYNNDENLTEQEENYLIGAMATVVVYMEYLSKMYTEAAKKGKIIIANIQAN